MIQINSGVLNQSVLLHQYWRATSLRLYLLSFSLAFLTAGEHCVQRGGLQQCISFSWTTNSQAN